jgi:hypothetical protein
MQHRLAPPAAAAAAVSESPIRVSGDSYNRDAEAPARILSALAGRRGGVRAWAEARGYRWRTVYRVIEIWSPRRDRAPLGGMGRQIMADLRADLGTEVVPEPTGERR